MIFPISVASEDGKAPSPAAALVVARIKRRMPGRIIDQTAATDGNIIFAITCRTPFFD